MNRGWIIHLTAIVTFGFAFLPATVVAQQTTLREQLSGIWTIVSQENIAPNGDKRQPLGSNPKGILIPDGGGRYTLVIVKADRPKFKSRNRSEITTEEFASAAAGTVAQFGSWSVNDKTLVRHVEGALIPNTEGIEAKVSIDLSGDELRFTDQGAVQSGGATTVTVFRRSK